MSSAEYSAFSGCEYRQKCGHQQWVEQANQTILQVELVLMDHSAASYISCTLATCPYELF